MKKLFALLVVTIVIGSVSCKKDSNIKPALPLPPAQPKEKVAVGVFDYQKAILVKRTLNVNL